VPSARCEWLCHDKTSQQQAHTVICTAPDAARPIACSPESDRFCGCNAGDPAPKGGPMGKLYNNSSERWEARLVV
jgi:hypothetical protein